MRALGTFGVAIAIAMGGGVGEVHAKGNKDVEPVAGPVEVPDPIRARLKALTDGNGHYLLVIPRERKETDDAYRQYFFVGDGKVFHQVEVGLSGDHTRYDWSFFEPRFDKASVEVAADTVTVVCEDRRTSFWFVADGEAKKIVAEAKLFEPRWRWRSHFLARDDRGTYYYVDRERGESSRSFRVWSGPRGNMKRLKMKNIVLDPAGEIFATDKGELRLVVDKSQSATWIKGKQRTTLTQVDVLGWETAKLIYTELGVYRGAILGTPCEDL